MLENHVRIYYQQYFLDPIAKSCQPFFSAMAITSLACLTGILITPALYLHHSLTALILLCLSGFLDTLDGTMARLKNQSSDIGSLFDIVSDRIVECAIIIGFFVYDPTHRAMSCIILLSSIFICITNFLMIAIFMQNNSHKSFYYNNALIERFEAFIFFALMICLPHYFNFLAYVLSTLVLLTAFQHSAKLIWRN